MSEEKRRIVVIVGSNPLPNILVVANEEVEEVNLVYSKETDTVARRLRRHYKASGLSTENIIVRDATDLQKCKSVVTDQMAKYRLDYTGGTKVMSAAIHSEWSRRGGTPSRASYVDDRAGLIRFDDGRTKRMDFSVDIDALLRAHGLNLNKERYTSKEGPKFKDACVMAKGYLTDPDKIIKMGDKIKNKTILTVRPRDYGYNLSQDAIGPNLDSSALSEWKEFVTGKWLELWVGGLIGKSGLMETGCIHIGLKVQMRNSRFELDVVAMHKHRAHLVSCTTSPHFSSIKLKLFEAMIRSRQIGGSLAKTAIVAPLGKKKIGDGRIQDQLATLQQTVTEMWDSPNPPRVFGIEHMKEWAGINGTPRLKSLYDWLEF